MLAAKPRHPFLVTIVSLGCPKNFVDTEVAAAAFLKVGLGIAVDPESASARFINTCAFIPPARAETEEEIVAAVEWKKLGFGRIVMIGGCLNSWDKDGVFRKKYPEVDLWLGRDQVAEAGKLLLAALSADAAGGELVGEAPISRPFLYDHSTPRLQLTPGHYAYLKIADGCGNKCAYCSIPAIRGDLRSRDAESVVREARGLVEGGVRELIVIAQDTAAFGAERGSPADGGALAKLLGRLGGIPGDFWIRLMYAHPAHFSAELIAEMARNPRLVPYIDLPMQHASDAILAKMGRRTTRRYLETLIGDLRSAIPAIAIRTTFMVGFPGEGRAEFKELLDFAAAQRFERLGAFVYHPEPGTAAASMPERPTPRTSRRRLDELMTLQLGIATEINKGMIGRQARVLVDEVENGVAVCRSAHDAPDIDNVVLAKLSRGRRPRPGDFIDVEITAAAAYELEAKLPR